ncbi:MAG TPA: AMP-binding protein, partial [Rhabdochlamydiaceae bacterium]
LLYTSGTTGKPKGIMHATGGFLVGVHNTFKWVFDIKDSDVYWCTADMGWITGTSYAVYGPLSNGATQVIYEGAPEYPEKDRVWEIVEKHKVSIFFTAPTLIRTFVKWGEEWVQKHNIASIRLLGSVGEPINPEVWNWYRDHVGGGKAPIVDTWFQTETATFFIAPLPGLIPLKPGSVTRALPGYEIAILDEEENRVEKGLLAITKPYPSMLRGIYGDQDKFHKTYWDKWDGKYYFTGDGASFDEHGYVWVYGRIDDVIKVAAHRIGSAELENMAVEHQAVAEAAAIGVPDELKGEEIVMFVVLKQGFAESGELEQSIKNCIVKNAGPFARPKSVLFVGELPKNRSGKILRRLLRSAYSGQPLGDITTLESKQAVEEIQKKCQRVFPS